MASTFRELIRRHGNWSRTPNFEEHIYENLVIIYENLVMSVYSNDHEYLTLKIALQAIRGLRKVLIDQHRYCTVSFDIIEDGFGRVGFGSIDIIAD